MKQLTSLAKIDGLTVERTQQTLCDYKQVIFFEDSYIILCGGGGYEGEESVGVQVVPLDDYELVHLGLLTQEELDITIKKEESKKKKTNKEARRKNYLSLKKEFESE